MQARFVLGPAGSGKTFRCLAEIRAALLAAPDGPPLVMLAPRQATFQLERHLLADPSLPGYTRLHILSFERLAEWILSQLQKPLPPLLSEEGRVMVLRALLAGRRDQLQIFHASARAPGFAQQLGLLLREFQHYHLLPKRMETLAAGLGEANPLSRKLHDVALLMRAYLDWFQARPLHDADGLLELATQALLGTDRNKTEDRGQESEVRSQGSNVGQQSTAHPQFNPKSEIRNPKSSIPLAGLWLDGFAEMTPQELDLLAAVVSHCKQAVLAFCLEREPSGADSWLSPWSLVSEVFSQCHQRIAALPDCSVTVELLPRDPLRSRFANQPVLAHLERFWARPEPFAPEARTGDPAPCASFPSHAALRLVLCPDPEAEGILAAHEILRFVRAGGRYRDCAVLLRQFKDYSEVLRRVFSRYAIPFFLDRRESMAHHPLAELTRYALRIVAFGWDHDDWFGALKTGLVYADQAEIDELENQALARGWNGAAWRQPLKAREAPALERRMERLRQELVPPFLQLANSLGELQSAGAAKVGTGPGGRLPLALADRMPAATGATLAAALREFWQHLQVEQRLMDWSTRWPGTPQSALSAGAASLSAGVVRDGGAAGRRMPPLVIHLTVWRQMQLWLDDLALAFASETLPLDQWLPILEAGLGGLTVGVVPPALDQVLVGTVDRSRNPDLQLALVLGLNESVFPAIPTHTGLLSETDRQELESRGIKMGPNKRAQLGRERYYGYIACTRARQRLVLSCALRDTNGRVLNPSPFLSQVKGLFPTRTIEEFAPPKCGVSPSARTGTADSFEPQNGTGFAGGAAGQRPALQSERGSSDPPQLSDIAATGQRPALQSERPAWLDSQHLCELVPLLWSITGKDRSGWPGWAALTDLPVVRALYERLESRSRVTCDGVISPAVVEALYGQTLSTSVTRLEEFAACPFKFFVSAGLRAAERQRFELDAREQGSFLHAVLARFHQQVRAENKQWRDLSPAEARGRIGQIASRVAAEFRAGLLQASDQSRFAVRGLSRALEDFIETIVGWMAQYEFNPHTVELEFGTRANLEAWELDLGEGHRLALVGKIDRVDLWADPAGSEALCVVIDYKSGMRRLDSLLLAGGVQLQLPAYLGVLRRLKDPRPLFGVARLIPAGVFYVNLLGRYRAGATRDEVLAQVQQARQSAYQHTGRFDLAALRKLDKRAEVSKGDQFNYRLTRNGQPYKNCADPMAPSAFLDLLDQVETHLKEMGRRIFMGLAKVDPYRRGKTTACDQCQYQPICRIDPWTHPFRTLTPRIDREP